MPILRKPSFVITSSRMVSTCTSAAVTPLGYREDELKQEALISALHAATGQAPPSRATRRQRHSEAGPTHHPEHQVPAVQQNKMIAYHPGISVRMVEVHRANVMAEIGARNLAELMRIW